MNYLSFVIQARLNSLGPWSYSATLVKLVKSKLSLVQKPMPSLLASSTSAVKGAISSHLVRSFSPQISDRSNLICAPYHHFNATELLDWKVYSQGLSSPLTDGIPQQFHGLVVKLCHERYELFGCMFRRSLNRRNCLDPAAFTHTYFSFQ